VAVGGVTVDVSKDPTATMFRVEREKSLHSFETSATSRPTSQWHIADLDPKLDSSL
jgi:hypothetical protein